MNTAQPEPTESSQEPQQTPPPSLHEAAPRPASNFFSRKRARTEKTYTPVQESVPLKDRVVARTRSMATWTGIAIITIFIILLLLFVLQNSTRVQVTFLAFHFWVGLGNSLLGAALLGGVIVAAISFLIIVRLRFQMRKLSKSLK